MMETTHIEGIGNIKIQTKSSISNSMIHVLHDVNYISQVTHNLLSLGKCKEWHYTFHFHVVECITQKKLEDYTYKINFEYM